MTCVYVYLLKPDFAGGEVPFADLSISYDGPSGPVQEILGEAPESERHSSHSLPPGFDGVSVFESWFYLFNLIVLYVIEKEKLRWDIYVLVQSGRIRKNAENHRFLKMECSEYESRAG